MGYWIRRRMQQKVSFKPVKMPPMVYILDAYNVLHKMRRFETALDQNLRAAREALTNFCAALKQSRGDIASIILVFDGRSEFRDLPQIAPQGIQLVFSETNEDADDRIATLLEELPAKPMKCVVSDDNSVKNHARAFKARVMSVAEFESLANTAAAKNKAKVLPPAKPALAPDLADKITEAYKKALGL